MAEKQPGGSDADSPDAQPEVGYSPVDGRVLRVALLSREGQVPASILELVAGEAPPVIIAWNGTLARKLIIAIQGGLALDAALVEASLGARNASSSLVIGTLREHGVPAVLLGPSPLALARRALIAGAAGIIDNEADPHELLSLLRKAATGEIVRTDTYNEVLTAALPELTNREADVLTLMSQGLTYRQIARQLNIAEGTVGKYVEGIRGKYRALGVPDVGTSQLLLVRAGRDGFLDEPRVSPIGSSEHNAIRIGNDPLVVTPANSIRDAAGNSEPRAVVADTDDADSLGLGTEASPNSSESGYSDVDKSNRVGNEQARTLAHNALFVTDDISAKDALGRNGLAAHLDALIYELAAHQPDHTSVTHLDGRWGSGKSTLVELMLHPERTGSAADDRMVASPVVVRYDAWRESAVAPEWWSVASTIHRGVAASRALPARAAMLLFGGVDRVWRTPSIWVAGLVLVLIWWAIVAFGSEPSTLKNLDAIKNVVAIVTVIALLAITLGRLLFWTAPAFGRIDLKASDNPLAEISEQVARMRRWAPRRFRAFGSTGQVDEQRLMDWALFAACTGALGLFVLDVRRGGQLVPGLSWSWQAPAWTDGWGTLVGGLTLAFALGLYCAWLGAVATRERRAILLVIDDLDRCSPERVVRLLETVHTVLRRDKVPKCFREWRKPAALIVLVLADGRWVRTAFEMWFKDYKDLGTPVHSLGADFIQKVFDHTVVVPSLTAAQVEEFLRVILDSPEEVSEDKGRFEEADGLATGANAHREAGEKRRDPPGDPAAGDVGDEALGELARRSHVGPVEPDETSTVEDRRKELEALPPGEMYSAKAEQILRAKDLSKREQASLVGVRARRAVGTEATQQVSAHLLNKYGKLMPANPRLIKRVADAWGMLQELDWYLGNEFDDDVIARGAIVLVRFPSLASELLSAPVLPGESGDVDTGETDESKALSEMWARPDVTSVVGNVTARQLARCFGREAVAEAETERTGEGDSASSTESLPQHATDDCDDANDAGGHV